MATAQDFTFTPITLNSLGAVLVTKAVHVRDRYNNLLRAKPGDYVVQWGDGTLTVASAYSIEGYES